MQARYQYGNLMLRKRKKGAGRLAIPLDGERTAEISADRND
jgi:hypothetical protein